MNISSISNEIGLTLHAGTVAKANGGRDASTKAVVNKSSTIDPDRSAAAELQDRGIAQGVGGAEDSPPAPIVVNGLGLGLKFSVDKETNTQVIEVIELKSGDVVRQIPPEEVINFLRAVRADKGVLLSRRL